MRKSFAREKIQQYAEAVSHQEVHYNKYAYFRQTVCLQFY